jgi:hypothetical protein
MKKNEEEIKEIKENKIEKNEQINPTNSNKKTNKKLVQLPFYKLEELKNKEIKKNKPLPKLKKRQDHNMPKLFINNNLIKPKKKKVILKKNQNNNDINTYEDDFILEKNIVNEIFSEENLLKTNIKSSYISIFINLI